MSNEFEIPPELAAFESKLAAAGLPDATCDRDEIMFRAGWAAAMRENTTDSADRTVNREAKVASQARPVNWAWRSATGALAALATVLAVMLFQKSAIELPDLQPSNVAPASVVQSADETEISPNSFNESALENFQSTHILSVVLRTDRDPNAFTSRSYSNALHWEVTQPTHTYFGDSDPAANPQSNYELLNELIPGSQPKSNRIRTFESGNDPPVWDWFSQTLGDLI